jgi:hypothetical protein
MSVLSAAARKKIPSAKLGEPGKRAYPMPDREHAANAKARAKQQLHKGRLDRQTYEHIVRMADSILAR